MLFFQPFSDKSLNISLISWYVYITFSLKYRHDAVTAKPSDNLKDLPTIDLINVFDKQVVDEKATSSDKITDSTIESKQASDAFGNKRKNIYANLYLSRNWQYHKRCLK